MTAEEVFNDLYNKYGDNFNWHILPCSSKTFVSELKREIAADHFLYNKDLRAVAKCDSNDNVLYVTDNQNGGSIYYIFHLTYSAHNPKGFPKYKDFADIYEVKNFIEQDYIANYL